MRYKHLNRTEAPTELQLQALQQCGAMPLCPDFLIEMDPVYHELQHNIQEEQQKLAEWRRNDADRVAKSKARAKSMSRRRR